MVSILQCLTIAALVMVTPITDPSLSVLYSMYAGVSSVSLGVGVQSFGVLVKCSVTNHVSLGHPLNWTTSPDVVFGSPFKHASEVRATCTLQLPKRKPIWREPASRRVIGTSMGTGTMPAWRQP